MKRKELKLIISYEPFAFGEFCDFMETILNWHEDQQEDNLDKNIGGSQAKKDHQASCLN